MVRSKRPYHCGKTQYQNSEATAGLVFLRRLDYIYNADQNNLSGKSFGCMLV